MKYAGSPTERFATELATRKRKKAGKAEPEPDAFVEAHGCRLPAFLARMSEDEAIAWLEIHGGEDVPT